MISEKVKKNNFVGIIPGVDESYDDFIDRSNAYRSKSNNKDDVEYCCAMENCRQLYDICPNWVEVDYSDSNLAPWHGGVAWYEECEGGIPKVTVQLRKAFKKNSNYLGLYSSKEILAHEMVHAGRFSLGDSCFEEFFAYKTSNSFLRRFFGPIVERPWEVLLLMVLSFFALIMNIVATIVPLEYMLSIAMASIAFPLFWLLLGVVRLLFRHYTLYHCYKRLEEIGVFKPLHLMYRLSDQEIKEIASMNVSHIDKKLKEYAKVSWRWEMLLSLYVDF